MTTKRTALVTGASAGIGRSLASLFARDGHDVVLVARSRHRLEAIAAELTAAHQVKVEVIDADLADPSAPAQVFAEAERRGLVIDFLVNNAGFGSSGPFLDQPVGREADMVEVNCNALLKLSHLFGEGMRRRRFGRILNIASTAGFQAGPYMATYFATKNFVLAFSEALAYELAPSGVSVTAHCPGATASEFAATAGNDKSRLFQQGLVASSDEVAADAYAAMMAGKVLAVHGWLNAITATSVRFFPRSWVRTLAAIANLPPGA